MERRRVRIYSDRSEVAPGVPWVVLLFALWGKPPELAAHVAWPEFADAFVERGGEWFEAAGPGDADLAVYPVNWKWVAEAPERVGRAEAFAARAGRPVVYFYEADSADPLPVPDAFTFRTSLHRSQRSAREFALPGFHDDLLRFAGGELSLREKRERPVVGFCGWIYREQRPAGALGRLRRAAGDVRRGVQERRGVPLPQDIFVRERALAALAREPRIELAAVLREQGGGGALYPTLDRPRWETVRAEYVANIVESDYVLCARGAGNWSWRLYETLSLGRIPVFVDTDCVLPYDFLLDWRELVVWVDRTELPRIGEKVAEFHAGLSDAGFRERQRQCRRVWEEYLTPQGFFANFHRHPGLLP